MPGEPKSLRVVIDTNVLISALAFGGHTKNVWTHAENDEFDLLLSEFIIDELIRNLAEKTRLPATTIKTIRDNVADCAEIIKPTITIKEIKAKDEDNRILECAVTGMADVIVTGNLKHIRPLGKYRGIEILTPREFLDRYFS